MPTARKAAVIEELTDKLGRINAAALIDYRGLTVAEINALRGQLRQRGVELRVAKNTLLREAARRNNLSGLDEIFAGPMAVAFIYGEEAAGSKALNDYFRTARVGQVTAGLVKGGRALTAEQFAKLADLPSRETLLAQIAGLLQSPMAQLASLFNAPAQQLAYALANFEQKGGAGGAATTPASAAAEPPATAGAPTEASEPAPVVEASVQMEAPESVPVVEAPVQAEAPESVPAVETPVQMEAPESVPAVETPVQMEAPESVPAVEAPVAEAVPAAVLTETETAPGVAAAQKSGAEPAAQAAAEPAPEPDAGAGGTT